MEKVLTRNIGLEQTPTDLKAYEANGGYQGLRKAMAEMSPKDCQDVISASNLRGRGGAGFPTGMKWSFVPAADKSSPGHRYLVCNADEMEPGTFKDRLLMECDPHQLIEGMILAAYTIGADISYIFIRGEYIVAIQRLRDALAECYNARLLGDNILGSGYSLHMHVHPSAGRYICGEETALINALEGSGPTPEPNHHSLRSVVSGGVPPSLTMSKPCVISPISLTAVRIGTKPWVWVKMPVPSFLG